MPRIKTVSVTYERKINLGDFNSLTAACSIWAQLDIGETEHEAMSGLWEMARNNVKDQVARVKARPGAMNVEETFLGIPVIDQESAQKIANTIPEDAKNNPVSVVGHMVDPMTGEIL